MEKKNNPAEVNRDVTENRSQFLFIDIETTRRTKEKERERERERKKFIRWIIKKKKNNRSRID